MSSSKQSCSGKGKEPSVPIEMDSQLKKSLTEKLAKAIKDLSNDDKLNLASKVIKKDYFYFEIYVEDLEGEMHYLTNSKGTKLHSKGTSKEWSGSVASDSQIEAKLLEVAGINASKIIATLEDLNAEGKISNGKLEEISRLLQKTNVGERTTTKLGRKVPVFGYNDDAKKMITLLETLYLGSGKHQFGTEYNPAYSSSRDKSKAIYDLVMNGYLTFDQAFDNLKELSADTKIEIPETHIYPNGEERNLYITKWGNQVLSTRKTTKAEEVIKLIKAHSFLKDTPLKKLLEISEIGYEKINSLLTNAYLGKGIHIRKRFISETSSENIKIITENHEAFADFANARGDAEAMKLAKLDDTFKLAIALGYTRISKKSALAMFLNSNSSISIDDIINFQDNEKLRCILVEYKHLIEAFENKFKLADLDLLDSEQITYIKKAIKLFKKEFTIADIAKLSGKQLSCLTDYLDTFGIPLKIDDVAKLSPEKLQTISSTIKQIEIGNKEKNTKRQLVSKERVEGKIAEFADLQPYEIKNILNIMNSNTEISLDELKHAVILYRSRQEEDGIEETITQGFNTNFRSLLKEISDAKNKPELQGLTTNQVTAILMAQDKRPEYTLAQLKTALTNADDYNKPDISRTKIEEFANNAHNLVIPSKFPDAIVKTTEQAAQEPSAPPAYDDITAAQNAPPATSSPEPSAPPVDDEEASHLLGTAPEAPSTPLSGANARPSSTAARASAESKGRTAFPA